MNTLIARRTARIAAGLLSLVWLPAMAAGQGSPPCLIPRPVRITPGEGRFVLDARTVIRAAPAEADLARLVAEAIAAATALRLPVEAVSAPGPRPGGIVLGIDPALQALGDEGYRLEVTPGSVSVTAARQAGLFRGIQTLRQLMPAVPVTARAEYPLDCVSIEDSPRFRWRGYLLDSSRHFITKATVLRLLDALALFKINVFHWHLVDDQAWRLEIAKYPGLVRPVAGSWNASSQGEGYYSAGDVREIVERARRLHIMIVPEIEMPSHATQAASVLPEGCCLGGDGKPLPPGATREICLGSDRAIGALQDVLVEVMAMFPDSPYIHLGGDEAEDVHWKACSRCKARMASLGLVDPRLAQKWFMTRMNRFVREHGRTSVAWADRLALGIPEGQIVHDWHAGEMEEAVARGFQVICSRHDYTYFDYGQGPGDSAFGGAALDVARVYALDPTRNLTPEQARLVLGPQAQLWTELVTDDGVFAKTFPRILALAEVGWTPQERRDATEFAGRLQAFLPRLSVMGIPCFLPAVQIGTWNPPQMSEAWQDLEWDVTRHVGSPGPLSVQLLYRKGQHGLEIQSVALLEGGREIGRDEHPGFTGAAHTRNTYQVRLPPPRAGVAYTVRARVRSKGGTDSAGEVLFR
jgi:hexosaminidase